MTRYRAEATEMAKDAGKRVSAMESFASMCTLLGGVVER
jgi:hypothetical protein